MNRERATHVTSGGAGPVGRPPFARGGVDRQAWYRRDPERLAEAWARCRVLVLQGDQALVSAGGDRRGDAEGLALVFLGPEQVSEEDTQRYFLGVDEDGTPYFVVLAHLPKVEGARPMGLRECGHALSDRDSGLFATGLALANWHSRAVYSPRTGRRTTPGEAGWVRADQDHLLWPRTDPASIVLVHDGAPGPDGRCLLASNAAWSTGAGPPRYSCLAGFVEPGESAEAAAEREVYEEVGLAIRDVTYVTSQPWPFPGSLMIGFVALADPADELSLDPVEIADARWFTRKEICAVLAGEPAEFGLPMPVSIARFLMELWAAW